MSAPATATTVLARSLSDQRRPVLVAAALFMTWQACEALVPVAIGAVIDDAISDADSGGAKIVGWLAALAVLFAVLSASFRYASRWGARAQQQAAHALRVAMAEHVLDPAVVPDTAHRPSAMVSVAGMDAERAAVAIGVAPRVLGALVSVVFAAVTVLAIDVRLGLVVVIGCPTLILLLQRLNRPLERRATNEQAHAADAAALAADLMTGLRVLKGIGGERDAARRYTDASRRSLVATVRAARVEAAIEGATTLCTLLFLAGLAFFGGRLAADGRIGVGQLVAAVGLAQFLLGPLDRLTKAGAVLARARASADRIADVLTIARYPVPGGRVPDRGRGSLTLDHLGVEIGSHQLVGVVGDSATGSALIDRLVNARGDDRVRLDEIPLSQWHPHDAQDAIMVLRHDTTLFATSIIDNVRIGRIDDDVVQDAMTAADAHEVARALPDGVHTRLSEHGRSLSGGQRQRVALARALAARAAVLVLHEPTTAVDPVTEARIAVGLRKYRTGTSTVVVTTSPVLLASCDRVLHLDGDTVVADGCHDQLINSSPYRELVFS